MPYDSNVVSALDTFVESSGVTIHSRLFQNTLLAEGRKEVINMVGDIHSYINGAAEVA